MQEGIFRVAGSVKTVKEIVNDINQKGPQVIAELAASTLNCVCSILKQWIRDIPEGFLGEQVHQKLNQAKGILYLLSIR